MATRRFRVASQEVEQRLSASELKFDALLSGFPVLPIQRLRSNVGLFP